MSRVRPVSEQAGVVAKAGPVTAFRRIGHKGADAISHGNTPESFEAAADAGVDMIELDVLRLRDGRLVIAHDYADAARREPLSLTEGLDLFTRPPLDAVELDCDLKLPGGEAELAAALDERGLIDRAMVSTMYVSSIAALRGLEPDLRLGWTYPKVSRDWDRIWWAKPGVAAMLVLMRARLPRLATRTIPRLGVRAMWVFHPLVSPRLATATRRAGVELITWTVDDAARMRALLAMGVDGICSNDPRLFAAL
jgi:glycerophosphoryl diester phosphodiesterase